MNDGSSPTAPRISRPSGRLRALVPFGVLVGCVFVVYANAIGAGFVADDPFFFNIVSRPRTAADLLSFFHTPVQVNPAIAPVETKVYRPLFFVYGAFAYRLFGKSAWAWHAANVALHAINSCLALVILRRVFGLAPHLALLAAVLWAVHPVQVEAVTYVTGVNYLLPGVFLFLAVLVASGRWPGSWPSVGRALVAVAAFTGAILSHELGLMVAPLAALAFLAAPGTGWPSGHRPDRGSPVSLAIMAVATLVYVVLRLTVIDTGKAGQMGEAVSTLGLRLLQAPEIFLRYLALLAFPARLTLDRSLDIPTPSGVFQARFILTWCLCGLLLWVTARVGRLIPSAPFGLAWFFLAYLPVSNSVIPLYSLMAERYLYAASLGIIGGGIAVAHGIVRACRLGRAAALAAIVVVVPYGARTVIRNHDWHNEFKFYQATVKASPGSAYMHNNLGKIYQDRGQLDLAERAYRAATEADPTFFAAYYNLGTVALAQGYLNKSEAYFHQAKTLRRHHAEGYYGLSIVAHRRGQEREAIAWLSQASGLPPAFVDTDLYMGMTYLALDRDRAAHFLNRFVSLAPDHPRASAIRELLGQIPKALQP